MTILKTYYCDGSQQKELGKMGIGIVVGEEIFYEEYADIDWKLQIHEVMAIAKTVELAIARGDKNITIVNDDLHLVQTLNNYVNRNKNIPIRKRSKYKNLINLLKTNKIKLVVPSTRKDAESIRKAHHVSRLYLEEPVQSPHG